MKKIIIALAAFLIVAPSFAAQVSCERFGQIAYNASQERDRGVPQEEVVKGLKKNFNDDRIEAVVKVVFMHEDQDAGSMQLATRLWCLQQAEASNDATQKSVPAAPVAAPQTDPTAGASEGKVAAAAEAKRPLSHTFYVCMDKAAVTSEALACLDDESSKQDAVLNTNYRSVMRVLPSDKGSELLKAERAWIKQRDSKCAVGPDGGRADQLDSAACALDMTTQRAKELLAMMPDAKP